MIENDHSHFNAYPKYSSFLVHQNFYNVNVDVNFKMNEYLVVCTILYSFWGDGGGAGSWRRQKLRRGKEEGGRRDRSEMKVGRGQWLINAANGTVDI